MDKEERSKFFKKLMESWEKIGTMSYKQIDDFQDKLELAIAVVRAKIYEIKKVKVDDSDPLSIASEFGLVKNNGGIIDCKFFRRPYRTISTDKKGKDCKAIIFEPTYLAIEDLKELIRRCEESDMDLMITGNANFKPSTAMRVMCYKKGRIEDDRN